MTKAELLTQIESDSLGVVRTDVQESGSFSNGKTYTKYNTNVLVKEGESQNFKNIPFTVINEGQPDEDAFLTQGQQAPKLDVARQAVKTYMESLPNVIRFVIGAVNEETQDARVVAIVDNGNGTATEKQFVVYKNGTDPIAHVELT